MKNGWFGYFYRIQLCCLGSEPEDNVFPIKNCYGGEPPPFFSGGEWGEELGNNRKRKNPQFSSIS